MISTLRRSALVASGVLCVAIAAAAVAQPAPPPANGPGAAAGERPWRDPAQREADKARRLAEVLQLRPDQQGALHAFLDAMAPRGGPDGHDGMRPDAQAQDQNLTTPQRLDRMLAHFDEMRTRLVARSEATKAFYAQLSPSQQQAFDVVAVRWERRHGLGGGDGHGWGHGPDQHGPQGPGGGPQG